MKYLLFALFLAPFFAYSQPGQCPDCQGTILKNLENTFGWAEYADDQYTSVSPLTITAGDTVTVFNNVASSITSDLPIGIDSLWNRTDSTIIAQNVGDAYTIRIDFYSRKQ